MAETSAAMIVKSTARLVRKAALATLEVEGGHPWVSLVTVATDPGGAPLLLLSGLARHTRHLRADARCSLLIDGTDAHGDPLAGARATLAGRASTVADDVSRRRFLAKHPDAAGYASFADFAFWRIEVERAQLIGGFGRIVEIGGDQLVSAWGPGDPLVAGEPEMIASTDSTALARLLAVADREGRSLPRAAQAPVASNGGGEAWRLTGIDRDGFDAVSAQETRRATFVEPITTPEQWHRLLASV